jgi:hypothetical protein
MQLKVFNRLGGAITVCLCGSTAWAISISPNQTGPFGVPAAGSSFDSVGAVPGATELGFTSYTLNDSPNWDVTMNIGVYAEGSGSASTLDFLYQLANGSNCNSGPCADSLLRVAGSGYFGSTNVGYLTGTIGSFSNAGTVAPSKYERDSSGQCIIRLLSERQPARRCNVRYPRG